jgi:predicted metalloprotease with PDZ domain
LTYVDKYLITGSFREHGRTFFFIFAYPVMRPCVAVFLLYVFVLMTGVAAAQQQMVGAECKVTLDLINVAADKDRIHVTIITPPIEARQVRYVLPAYLPGIGKKADAGQFVHQFYALDDRGLPVKAVKKDGGNVILLRLGKGRTLRKIDYWIDDTWDTDDHGKNYHNDDYNHVPNAAGTSFRAGEQFLLNSSFMFGYIEGYSWIPYRLTVLHDESLHGFTSLSNTERTDDRDEFYARSYTDLVEYPLYYGTPDTCGFQSDNLYIDIAVYSESGTVTARQIRRYIGAEIAAMTRFLGNIPEQHYKMLFYLVSPKDFKAGTKGVFGGVAHRNSAVYYLLESSEEDQLISTVVRESSGDVLKVLTMLDPTRNTYGSDFLVPQIKSNWWIAEGMKSYFTWIAELRDSVASETEFMAAVSAKMRLYDKVKSKSLVNTREVAKAMKDPLVAEEYKAKAMLTVFLLDINVTLLSGGETGLREVVLELNDSSEFRPDSLGKYLQKTISPDIASFFAAYVKGNQPLPVISSFDKIGWVYSPVALDSVLTFGQVSLYYDENADAFYVRDADIGNTLTLQSGDRLVSINGIHVDAANLDVALSAIYSPQSTEAVEVIFIRGNQNERVMAAPYFRTVVIDHIVRNDPASSSDAQLLHARIFSPFDY